MECVIFRLLKQHWIGLGFQNHPLYAFKWVFWNFQLRDKLANSDILWLLGKTVSSSNHNFDVNALEARDEMGIGFRVQILVRTGYNTNMQSEK